MLAFWFQNRGYELYGPEGAISERVANVIAPDAAAVADTLSLIEARASRREAPTARRHGVLDMGDVIAKRATAIRDAQGSD